MRGGLVVGIVLAALAVAAPSAHAQDPALPPYDYSQYDTLLNTIGITNLPPGGGGGNDEPAKKKKKAKRPTAAQLSKLRYRPTADVTQRLNQAAIDATGGDPATIAAQLDTARTEYRRVLTEVLRWRAEDVGDMAAFSLLQAYIKVHDDIEPNRDAVARLRREVRDDMASQRRVRRMSDTRKQEVAEVFELRSIYLISDIVLAQRAGDAEAEDSAREAMGAWAEERFGVDLAKVRLTRRGFVKR